MSVLAVVSRRVQRFVVGVVDRVRTPGAERDLLLQPAKATGAAVLAWVLAAQLLDEQAAFYAPMAALLMVQSTVYRSVSAAGRHILAVLLGVLLAMAAGQVLGVSPLSIAIVTLVALLLGQWRRLGDRGVDVAVYAVIILTFGQATHGGYLLSALLDIALGAAVGTTVNAVIVPPIYLRSADVAIGSLADSIGRVLEELADALRQGPDADRLDEVAARSERLGMAAREADRAVRRGSERLWWNPNSRKRRRRHVRRLEPAKDSLTEMAHHTTRIVRMVSGAVGDERSVQPPVGTLTGPIADLLERLASLARAHVRPVNGIRSDGRDSAALRGALDLHDLLAERVRRGEFPEPQAWAATGSVLFEIRRALLTLYRDNQPRRTADERAEG